MSTRENIRLIARSSLLYLRQIWLGPFNLFHSHFLSPSLWEETANLAEVLIFVFHKLHIKGKFYILKIFYCIALFLALYYLQFS